MLNIKLLIQPLVELIKKRAMKKDVEEIRSEVQILSEGMGNLVPEADQPNMQLVTDAEGQKKWEERGFYSYPSYVDYWSSGFSLSEDDKITFGDNNEYHSYETWDNIDASDSASVLRSIPEGSIVRVLYDGVPYEVIAGYGGQIGNRWLCYGYGDNTDEPFLLYDYDGFAYWFAEPGDHTVVVQLIDTGYKTLDDGYLSDGALRPDYEEFDPAVSGYIRNRPAYYSARTYSLDTPYTHKGMSSLWIDIGIPNDAKFPAGYEYKITIVARATHATYGAYGNRIETTGKVNIDSFGNWESLTFTDRFRITFPNDHYIEYKSLTKRDGKYVLCGYGASGVGSGSVNVNVTETEVECVLVKQLDLNMIPSIVPVIQSATVGQTVVVKSVDENGKPTEWESAGTTEEWTFTLEDGSTVTKKVVVME